MDIPKLLSNMCGEGAENLFSALIKPASIMAKDRKKDLLNIFMKFDLDQKKIFFDAVPYSGDMVDEQKYHYFGNNPAAAKQTYVVRDAGSMLNFWLGKPKGIMQNLYEFIGDGKLKELLKECQESQLFDEKGICEAAIQFREALGEVEFEVKRDKADKGLYINGDKVSTDKFINFCLEDESSGKFVLVIPQIIKDGENICISQDEGYLTAITESLQGESVGSLAVCHLCGKSKSDINTVEYSTKLSKSSIGKVFVTTTVNYSPLFNKSNHQKNYSLCKACYEKILFGEKAVMRDYKIRIAGEDCVLLFAGITDNLETKFLPALKANIDAVFNHKELDQAVKDLINEFDCQGMATYLGKKIHLYEFHMVFYRTDGKSTSVVKTIESISRIRFKEVNEAFEKILQERFDKFLTYFSLANIYRMIPVATNSKGEQLDIGRVLDFYSGILKGEAIARNVIFDFATEALEKGIRELNSAKLRNYKNLNRLEALYGKDYGKDFYSAEMVMMYLALIEVLQELKILNEEVVMMEKIGSPMVQYPEYIQEMEQFLTAHHFNMAQKKLFYMGVLMHLIGRAQYKQDHKTKPILDKITYSGMTDKEVLEFYLELQAKGRQYQSILLKNKILGVFEQIEGCVTRNLGEVDKKNQLTEKENVFFIKAGYSFCVLNYKNKGADNNDSSEE